MSHTKKRFEDLDYLDDFMMNAVTSDPDVGEDTCRKLIGVLLQRKLGKIRIVTQRIVVPSIPEHRGIRLDVEIEEMTDTDVLPNINIYDIEPHRIPAGRDVGSWVEKENLERKNRFYQAKIDRIR